MGFNPCFNGFMDKWCYMRDREPGGLGRFNPCFNGFMDKWKIIKIFVPTSLIVSTLVLMDSWINGLNEFFPEMNISGFNPCFNGFMDKWMASC